MTARYFSCRENRPLPHFPGGGRRGSGGRPIKRLHCDTAAWHVFARGARRLELFRDAEDFAAFLSILSLALRRSGCVLWAYALMTNHYHLVLYGSSDELTACMRRIGSLYSLYHNKRYGLSGHAFDGPYQAYRQCTPLLTLWTIAYVFLNPVKGGICPRPEDYPWSGYRSFLGFPGSPLPVDISALQPLIDPDPKRAWARFHDALRAELRRPPKHVYGRLTMIEVHIQQFGWLLDYATEHPVPGSDVDPTSTAIYWARKCGISPRAMAKALGMDDSREITLILRGIAKRIRCEEGLEGRLAPP
jgi:REP element-mobilizing transposase RayT